MDQTRLLELVRDAHCFARIFAHSIEAHPLLLYVSALPFTPTNTALYQKFHHHDMYPSISGGFQHTWASEYPMLQVLAGHREPVISVAFSPDGTRIVSSSFDASGTQSRVPRL
jgi:WD40 repeat protein